MTPTLSARTDIPAVRPQAAPGLQRVDTPVPAAMWCDGGMTDAHHSTPQNPLLPPAETETDLLAARVEGPDDHTGMTELWRGTAQEDAWVNVAWAGTEQ